MATDKPSDYFEIHSKKDDLWVYVGTIKADDAKSAEAAFKAKHPGNVSANIKAKQMKKFPKIADKFKSKK